MAELEVDGLTLRFGRLQVLDRVSLAVERGELFALIGPNGAGKTSVLNCISGIYRGEGAIRLRGQTISSRSPSEIAQLGVGRTFQHGELFADMSLVDNLLTGRHTRIRTHAFAEMLYLPSVRREEARQRQAVERIIEFVELKRYRHAAVDTLPLGLQKIVGLARALALQPAVLLLDEPSAGLDRKGREDLARFIQHVKYALGIAMVWIEHDMQMIADLADRIHVLDHGQSIAEGKPVDILQHPDVVEAYLGSRSP